MEADESFGGDLDLLSAGDGVDAGSCAAPGSGSDGRTFASSDDAAKDSSDGCSATDLFRCVGTAALAFDAVEFGGNGDFFAVAADAGEFDAKQGTAFVVSGLLNGGDAAGDGGALANDHEAVGDHVGGYGSGGTGQLGGDEAFITWAQETSFTDAFWSRQVQECWAVIWPEHLNSREFLDGVSLPQFAADYTALTGRPFPVPVPPAPVPAPPVPVPPAPALHDVHDQELWAKTSAWTTLMHTAGNKHAAQALRDWAVVKGLA